MPQTAISADVHQSLDVHLHTLAQIAFDFSLPFKDCADAAEIVFSEISHVSINIHVRFLQNRSRTRPANSINVRETDLCALIWRKIYTCDTSHLVNLGF